MEKNEILVGLGHKDSFKSLPASVTFNTLSVDLKLHGIEDLQVGLIC